MFTRIRFSLFLAALALFGLSSLAFAVGEAPQKWEVLVPTGVVQGKMVAPAPRINNLDGKTVVLRWNGKSNGDVILDRIAELLTAKYPKVKIVKSYTDKTLNVTSGNEQQSTRITDAVKALKPDLVIASQAD